MIFRRKGEHKHRQCRVALGAGQVTEYCTRGDGHDGPHVNVFTQQAWVESKTATMVPYDIAAAEADLPSATIRRSHAEYTMGRLGLETDCIYTEDVLAVYVWRWLQKNNYVHVAGKKKNGQATYGLRPEVFYDD